MYKSLLRWLTSSWRKGFLLPWKSWKQLQNKETTGLQIKISTASCVSWIRILLNNAKKQARPADWSVSMPSFLCRTVFSNYLFYFICTQNLRSKSLLLANRSGSPVIVTESIIEFVVVYTLWELILRLVFSNTECGAKQNWNHGLNGPQNNQSLSQHLKLFKDNQDSSCRGNNLFPVKANWILKSKTRRKTHQKRTYRNQRFLYIKNTWHLIVESYRVFMKINLYIKTISLRCHFLDFRSAVTYTSSYRSAEPELLLWRQSFSFGTEVVH